MGSVDNVGYDRFPKQGSDLGREVLVCFNYDPSRTIPGRIVRDDISRPFVTIIALTDGRVVLATECMYNVLPLREVTDV